MFWISSSRRNGARSSSGLTMFTSAMRMGLMPLSRAFYKTISPNVFIKSVIASAA